MSTDDVRDDLPRASLDRLRTLDLAVPAEAEFALRTIDAIERPLPAHESALRWAASQTHSKRLRCAALDRLVSLCGMTGRHGEAQQFAQQLLPVVTGTGTLNEVRVLFNLATTYTRQQKRHEALGVIARLERVVEALDLTEGRVRVAVLRAALLASLACHEEALALLDRALADAGDGISHDTELVTRRARAHARLRLDDISGAREDLKRIDELTYAPPEDTFAECAAEIVRCTVDLRAGRDGADLGSRLATLSTHARPWPNARLDVLQLRAQAAIANGDECATDLVRELFAIVQALDGAEHGWTHVLERARDVAHMAASVGEQGLAHEALDLAASAGLQRVRESVESYEPEGSEFELRAEDRVWLARAEEVWAKQQHDVCDAVVHLVRTGATPIGEWFRETVQDRTGHVQICAWCRRIRLRDGHWQLLGELCVQSRECPATHCICQSCLADEISGGSL